METPKIRKYRLLGTEISATTYDEVCRAIQTRAPERALTIACCNVHSLMEARRRPVLASAIADTDIATPDGMPLVWGLNALYDLSMANRVYGPDLMLEVLRYGTRLGWRHYLFGATPETLDAMSSAIVNRFPGVVLVGSEAPHFRNLNDDEVEEAAARMRRAQPDIVWLGLGMPKQELLMARLRPHLSGIAVVAVGAAFDFIAGRVRQAPRWMQDRGLEWAFRLSQEPRRLWRRYLLNNPQYLVLLGIAIARRRLAG